MGLGLKGKKSTMQPRQCALSSFCFPFSFACATGVLRMPRCGTQPKCLCTHGRLGRQALPLDSLAASPLPPSVPTCAGVAHLCTIGGWLMERLATEGSKYKQPFTACVMHGVFAWYVPIPSWWAGICCSRAMTSFPALARRPGLLSSLCASR